MAFVLTNYFNVLANEELDDVSKLTNDVPKKASTSLQASTKKQKQQQGAAKKKQETKPDAVNMTPKQIFVGKDRVIRREKTMIQTHTPKERPKFQTKIPKQKTTFETMEDQQQQEEVFERKLSTLKEYEEQLRGKKMALNALTKPDEEGKFSLDKDFKTAELVRKKKLEDINKFLKPLIRTERSFTDANEVVEEGRDMIKVEEFNIDDLDQFPTLN